MKKCNDRPADNFGRRAQIWLGISSVSDIPGAEAQTKDHLMVATGNTGITTQHKATRGPRLSEALMVHNASHVRTLAVEHRCDAQLLDNLGSGA